MWWIIGAIIAGIFGIAQAILDSLRKEVAVERQRWETSYRQVEQEVLKQQRIIEQELRQAQSEHSFQKLFTLYQASRKVADMTHGLLGDARKTLDAMGRAIVGAAQQRKGLEQRKKSTWNPFESSQLEKEIQALHKLRDEILIPDKNRVKADRDRISNEVTRLNQQTALLRDTIRDRCGVKGRQWYDSLMKRTEIRQINDERQKKGLPPLPIPSSKPKQIESRVKGIVKWYNTKDGYGFITPNSGSKDVYVSKKNLQGVSYLKEGDRVEFVIRLGNKGPWAANVRKM